MDFGANWWNLVPYVQIGGVWWNLVPYVRIGATWWSLVYFGETWCPLVQIGAFFVQIGAV